MWSCIILYLLTLAFDVQGVSTGGFNFLAPSGQSLFVFGASGVIPVFRAGRWWTFLTAGWLHAGVLHILFNMMWIRQLAPAASEMYGPSRMVIIYTLAGVTGFAASTLSGDDQPLSTLDIRWPPAADASAASDQFPLTFEASAAYSTMSPSAACGRIVPSRSRQIVVAHTERGRRMPRLTRGFRD